MLFRGKNRTHTEAVESGRNGSRNQGGVREMEMKLHILAHFRTSMFLSKLRVET
jgi:hypothetical protein